jgi:hypothetical protein
MRNAPGASVPTRHKPHRREESGFALLVIFLIAAAVAFTMYQELPRAAFESARDKEQLLMDRGNQYKRAIQVFYAENKHYPAELKDLESTANKRYLRRRYIDPMTGKDEWRLIHTNGNALTDSLVQKPPAQNARGGLPGQGQTPGGGPLGSNNMNTSPATATNAVDNASDPATAGGAPALNPMAQQRPSDRRLPTGPGFPQPPGSNPGIPAVGGANSFGGNSPAYDPADPRTWPAITVATSAPQSGQPQQAGPGGQQARGVPPFGTTPAGGLSQPGTGQFGGAQTQFQGNIGPANTGQANFGQANFGQSNFGQGNGQGGGNPQPSTLVNPNPTDPNGLGVLPIQYDTQNPPPTTVNPNLPFPPFGNQTAPGQQPQTPYPGGGQASAFQAANLAAGGFNPQAAPPSQNPLAGVQPNTGQPGNNSGNAALNAIDNSLFRPNQAPAGGAMGSPGIAGVASKFKGPSIKAYRERTKYQEWEFVYEPATNLPGANQPGANLNGQNPLGPAGAAGQNPLQSPNPLGTGAGQPAGGSAPSNPFSMPNPFGPSTAPTQ